MLKLETFSLKASETRPYMSGGGKAAQRPARCPDPPCTLHERAVTA